MDPTETLLKAIATTAHLMNTDLSADAARMFAADLAEYSEGAVLDALMRTRREHSGRLTVAAVLKRIDLQAHRASTDNRPATDWRAIKAESARLLNDWRATNADRLFQLDRFERWHVERIAKTAAFKLAQVNVASNLAEPVMLAERDWTSAHDRAESQPEITMHRYARPLGPLAEALPAAPDGGYSALEPPQAPQVAPPCQHAPTGPETG